MKVGPRLFSLSALTLALNGCAYWQSQIAPVEAEPLVEKTAVPARTPSRRCARTERNLTLYWADRYYWCNEGFFNQGSSAPSGSLTPSTSASTLKSLPPAAHTRGPLNRVPAPPTSWAPGSVSSNPSSFVQPPKSSPAFVPEEGKKIWFAEGLRVLGPDGRRRIAILASTLKKRVTDKQTIWLRGAARATELSLDDRPAIDQLSVDRALAVRQALRTQGVTAPMRIRKTDGVLSERAVFVSVL